jgi:hypothetical protein
MSEGWDKIEAVEKRDEMDRARCLALVRAEIEEGTKRGIPITSGTMIILHRLAHLIEHG